jgi:hypothetical protein
MFLVELRPGKEELYRSSDELALAIRNGNVDARSRIYHRATAKWISITLHPQYKAIISTTKDESPARPTRKGWSFLGGTNSAAEPPVADTAVSQGTLLHRWRGPMALGISGVLLILGTQLAFSGPRPPWSGARRPAPAAVTPPRQSARVVPTRAEERQEIVSLASTTTVWPAETPATVDTAAPEPEPVPLPSLPRAPRLRSTSLSAALQLTPSKKMGRGSVEAMLGRYNAAHDSARTRLEGGMRVARLARLFAAPRLSPNGGVTDTRAWREPPISSGSIASRRSPSRPRIRTPPTRWPSSSDGVGSRSDSGTPARAGAKIRVSRF